MGKTDGDWLPEKEAANLRAMKLQVLGSGVGKRNNVQITIEGKVHFCDLTVEPLREAAGDIIGITCVMTDISLARNSELTRQRGEDKSPGNGGREQ